LLVLLTALAAVLLAGCAEGDDAAQSAPTTAPPTTAPSTISPPPRAEAATCRDKSGDGKPADIKSVALRHDGDQLMVRFELTARPPTAGTTLWSISASSPSGDRVLQLGVKFQDGKQTAHYVFDAGSAEQRTCPA
jgi:hypothetical protein